MLVHHLHGLVIEERAVLNRVDAGANRDLRPFGAVCVRGGAPAEPMRLVDQRVHLRLRELRRPHIVGQRQDAAGRAHLDDVGAVLHLKADRVAELIRAAGDAVGDPRLRPEPLKRIPGVVAMAAARAKRVNRDEHARTERHAARDRIAQADVDVVGRPDVAHRREAGEQRPPCELGGAKGRFGNRAPQPRDRVRIPVVRRFVGDMGVRVDEAGEQRDVAKVDDLRAGRHRQPAALRGDSAPLHQDHRVRDRRVRGAVEQPRRPDRGHRRCLRADQGRRAGDRGEPAGEHQDALHTITPVRCACALRCRPCR